MLLNFNSVMCRKIQRASSLTVIIFCAFGINLCVVDSNQAKAVEVKSEFDAVNQVEFVNELKKPAVRAHDDNLCGGAKSVGGEMTQNSKSLRECLGKDLKRITIEWVAPAETRDLFNLGVHCISDALQKSPKTLYGYQPWANKVAPEFVGHLHYASGKVGALEVAYGYIAFQDANGKYWWSRFTSPDDLNLTHIVGTLRFQAGCYIIRCANGKVVWLQISENKILARQMENLAGKTVEAVGELRRMPENVTGSIPKGVMYLANGFTIDGHK